MDTSKKCCSSNRSILDRDRDMLLSKFGHVHIDVCHTSTRSKQLRCLKFFFIPYIILVAPVIQLYENYKMFTRGPLQPQPTSWALDSLSLTIVIIDQMCGNVVMWSRAICLSIFMPCASTCHHVHLLWFISALKLQHPNQQTQITSNMCL